MAEVLDRPPSGVTVAAEPRRGFASVLGWTALGALVPGASLFAAGRRRAGVAVLVVALAVLGAVLGAVWVLGRRGLLDVATSPGQVLALTVLGALLAICWAGSVVAGHLLLRGQAVRSTQRDLVGGLLVVVLVAAGLLPAARTVQYGVAWWDAAGSMFASGDDGDGQRPADAVDPWAGVPRVNVLLIGSDHTDERIGTRTDTVLVASIDTETGRTVLVSLPRNLEGVPFPPGSPAAEDYPEGFRCPDRSCLLNALWQFGVEHRDYYPEAGTRFEAGLEAVRGGVEQLLGLQVDTYAVVDIGGFIELVDAVGGVTVNITERLPVGGSTGAGGQVLQAPKEYIEPGIKKLGGWHAMWYARSRFGASDYDRMARQRCLIGNLVDQVDPMRVLRVFPQLAAALGDNIRTGVRTEDLSAWIELGSRVKEGGITSLSLTNRVVDVTDPDPEEIRGLLAEAIERSVAPPPAPSATPSGSATPSPSGKKKKEKAEPTTGSPVGNLTQVCPPVD